MLHITKIIELEIHLGSALLIHKDIRLEVLQPEKWDFPEILISALGLH